MAHSRLKIAHNRFKIAQSMFKIVLKLRIAYKSQQVKSSLKQVENS